MKWEYLQIYLDNKDHWIVFDGNSICDGDEDLIRLLNRLGQDRWEYCQYINTYHLLKRSLP